MVFSQCTNFRKNFNTNLFEDSTRQKYQKINLKKLSGYIFYKQCSTKKENSYSTCKTGRLS
uniref:Uncharacterized protein n=1 Tax=Romanomermis culicivorax TaxID=13658 RepID=A0A915IZY2_ROMCU